MANTELKNILMLTFNDGSKDRRLRIPNPREDLTGAEVKAAMDLVADNNFFWPGTAPKNAKIIKTETDQIDITAE